MYHRVCNFLTYSLALIACIAITVASPAQSASSATAPRAAWVGVWQGQLEGLPGVTLTLSDDLGMLNGTIVFTLIKNGNIAGHVTHLLLRPRVDGNTLSFQVKREGDHPAIVDMTLELTNDNTGLLGCPTCGEAPPTAMAKLP